MWHFYQVIATIWFCVVLCLCLVCIRLYVKITTHPRPWRELLLVVAWLSLLTHAIDTTISYVNHYYDGLDTGTRSHYVPSNAVKDMDDRLNFAGVLTYPMGLWACRALLLLTYQDFCPRHQHPKIFWAICFAWVVTIVGAFGVNVLYLFLMCLPNSVDVFWTDPHHVQNLFVTCPSYFPKWIFTYVSFQMFSNFLVFVIPIAIVLQLKNLKTIQKIGAAAMFSLGIIEVVFLLIEMLGVFAPLNNPHYRSTAQEAGTHVFMLILQLPTAIFVVCIPQLRVLGRFGKQKHIASIVSFGRRQMKDAGTMANASEDPSEGTDLEKGPHSTSIKSAAQSQ